MAKDMVQVRSARSNAFAQEPQVRIGRSQFDRSHTLKTTFDASYLIPIYVDEVLPGDTFTMRLDGFARILSPLDAPIMDNIELETFFFFVPCRLVWTNWQYFMGEHDAAGAQDTTFTIPVLSTGVTTDHDAGMTSQGQLLAYMGLPDGLATGSVDVNALPFRAYQLIYSEWFRDQNLIDRPVLAIDNGPDSSADLGNLRKSAKKHDYFTSALPYLQKGTASTVAISGTVDVLYDGATGTNPTIYLTTLDTRHEMGAGSTYVDANVQIGTDGPLYVDLSDAGTVDINQLRQAVAIQRVLERDARGGTRYVELIKAHFGVTSPDYRLQRPEYLGGGKAYINVTPVANTSDTTNAEQGELRGIGTGIVRGHGWAKSFTEHGYIIGMVRARGDVTYWQGLDKLWSRSTRYDFYLPALANLGEQSVLNQELYVSNDANDALVFGYQERWTEYRTKMNRLSGFFNPDTTGSLSFWHLAEDFSSLPSLNQTFIEDQTPMDRVTTTDTAHQFILDVRFDLKCARPMPLHSIPSLTAGRF